MAQKEDTHTHTHTTKCFRPKQFVSYIHMYTVLYSSRDPTSMTEPSHRMVKAGGESSRHYLNTLCQTIHFNMTNTSTSHQSCIASVIKGHAPLIHYHSITALHKYFGMQVAQKSLSKCHVHTLKLSHRKYNRVQLCPRTLTLKLSHRKHNCVQGQFL